MALKWASCTRLVNSSPRQNLIIAARIAPAHGAQQDCLARLGALGPYHFGERPSLEGEEEEEEEDDDDQ
eukprot:2169011-Pyramimonas_sp.AAC.1